MSNLTGQAIGITTVASAKRVECHAPSGFTQRDYSGANGARDRMFATILDFWIAQGIARTSCPRNNTCPEYARHGRCALGLHARDMVNDGSAWLPMATRETCGRADRAELSHVRAAAHGGAWCACNLLPEAGAVNAARGDADIATLTMSARAVLAAWPAWWKANVARKASLARIA